MEERYIEVEETSFHDSDYCVKLDGEVVAYVVGSDKVPAVVEGLYHWLGGMGNHFFRSDVSQGLATDQRYVVSIPVPASV